MCNALDITSAFSINTRAFYDLPVLRNYFAHRNATTHDAAVRVAALNGIPTPKHPADVLTAVPIGSTQMLLNIWMGDLEFVAEFLCA